MRNDVNKVLRLADYRIVLPANRAQASIDEIDYNDAWRGMWSISIYFFWYFLLLYNTNSKKYQKAMNGDF